MAASSVFSRGRTLSFLSLDQSPSVWLSHPLATLLPAFNEGERRQAEARVDLLMDRGCVEFCCVGLQAELLHDSIDEIVEKKGAFEVVTTWHTDYTDASEYFLLAAGGKSPTLLALVTSHPELVALLEKEAPVSGNPGPENVIYAYGGIGAPNNEVGARRVPMKELESSERSSRVMVTSGDGLRLELSLRALAAQELPEWKTVTEEQRAAVRATPRGAPRLHRSNP